MVRGDVISHRGERGRDSLRHSGRRQHDAGGGQARHGNQGGADPVRQPGENDRHRLRARRVLC